MNIKHNYPLSHSQARIFFLYRLQALDGNLCIPLALIFQGDLHIDLLERAINLVVEKHEILRTTFHTERSEPYQKVLPALQVGLDFSDISFLGEEQQKEWINKLIHDRLQQHFDLSTAPAFNVFLLRLREKKSCPQHILIIISHHIIIDDWSINIFIEEIIHNYQNLSNHNSDITALPLQYKDFATQQLANMAANKYVAQLDFWLEELKNCHYAINLPNKGLSYFKSPFKGEIEHFELGEELSGNINKLCRTIKISPFSFFITIYALTLYKYSSQPDICIGFPIANRTVHNTQKLIGLFVNILLFRINISAANSFRGILLQAFKKLITAYKNQDIPYDKIIHALKDRQLTMAGQSIFQVMFVMQDIQQKSFNLPNLMVQSYEVDYPIEEYNLLLSINKTTKQYKGALKYNANLYEDQLVKAILTQIKIFISLCLDKELFSNEN